MLRLDPTDPTKTKVETRDGREAEIYAVKEGQRYPVLGAIKTVDGKWEQVSWLQNGGFHLVNATHPRDLINAPEPPVTREVWPTIHADGQVIVWYSEPTESDIKFLKLKGVQKTTISVTPGKFDL